MTIAEWLPRQRLTPKNAACPNSIPMLDGLAQATERLRSADWNDNPDKDTPSTRSTPSTSLRTGQ